MVLILLLAPQQLVNEQVLADSRIVAVNGFVFDELPASVVLDAARHAAANGGAVFFDAGPRAWTLSQQTLRAMTQASHAVFMTQVGLSEG